MFLLKKIWGQGAAVQNFSEGKFQFVSGSNWNHSQRVVKGIKEENKRIIQKIGTIVMDTDYHKKLKADIKDYLQMRDHVRKIKSSPEKSGRKKKSHSLVKLERMQSKKSELKGEAQTSRVDPK